MFRMLQQNQSNASNKQASATDFVINNWNLDEWTVRMKSNFKGEKWACFALIGVLCCDVFLVLTLLAYKGVFSGKVRIPLMVTCFLLTCSGVFYLVASLVIYQRKKKDMHRVQYENTKEYVSTQLSLEHKTETMTKGGDGYEDGGQQIVAQEIQPGVILGKVVKKGKPIKESKVSFIENI